MIVEPSTVEVVDAVARIELQRREKEKVSGVPVSCSWALGRLHEVLSRERKSSGTSVESKSLRANIEAATQAIGQLRELAQTSGQRAALVDRRWRYRRSWRDAPS
jgi:hypothetical protein